MEKKKAASPPSFPLSLCLSPSLSLLSRSSPFGRQAKKKKKSQTPLIIYSPATSIPSFLSCFIVAHYDWSDGGRGGGHKQHMRACAKVCKLSTFSSFHSSQLISTQQIFSLRLDFFFFFFILLFLLWMPPPPPYQFLVQHSGQA